MSVDALAIIMRAVREAIQATGAPPDPLQDALAEAERVLRRSLGGGMHHISRLPQVSTRARIIELAQAGLPNPVIAQRLQVDGSYVRRVTRWMREADNQDASQRGTTHPQ